jgi:hypothetical protein
MTSGSFESEYPLLQVYLSAFWIEMDEGFRSMPAKDIVPALRFAVEEAMACRY